MSSPPLLGTVSAPANHLNSPPTASHTWSAGGLGPPGPPPPPPSYGGFEHDDRGERDYDREKRDRYYIDSSDYVQF